MGACVNNLISMPVEELQVILNGLLVDSWDAAQYLRLSPATLRNPKNNYFKMSVKIGQYRFWRRRDLEMVSPRTVKFTYICDWNESGPVRRTDEIKIEPFGDRGWQWKNGDARTNEAGNGLWWREQQQEGTGQFSLPRDVRRALYKLAKREAVFNSVGGEFEDLQIEYS